MRLLSHSIVNKENASNIAGRKAAEALRDAIGVAELAVVLVYATVEHDQEVLLQAARDVLGPIPMIGCSTGGLMGKSSFVEGGYAAGMVGLGGPALKASTALAQDVQQDTVTKAKVLGQKLRADLGPDPRVVILHIDSLCGADMETFARALQDEVGCPVIGGGAGQPWGAFVQTYQYFGTQVVSNSAVAVALGGEFVVEIGTTTGTEPTPLTATVTRTDGNVLLELDGRSALALLSEFVGVPLVTDLTADISSTVALGVELPTGGAESAGLSPYVVRAPFALDTQRGGLITGASVPEGIKVVFHRRSVQATIAGAEATAKALAKRLEGRTIRLVLGFECGARTAPFLGRAETLHEQLLVQNILAPDAEWLGMLAWGELAPFGGRVTYFNYTFPILTLAE